MNRYVHTFVTFSLVVTVTVLTACGGGGGGFGSDSPRPLEWGPGEPLEVAGTLGLAADISLNASGEGYAAWVEKDVDGTSRLVSQRYSDGRWQSRAEIITATADEALSNVRLVVRPDGQAFAVWTKQASLVADEKRLEGAQTQNGVWVPYDTPIQEGIENVYNIRLTGDGLGNGILVWMGRLLGETSGGHIYATTLTKDGLNAAEVISSGTFTVGDVGLELTAGANGEAIATWYRNMGDNLIYVRPYRAGQWTGAEPIAVSTGVAFTRSDPQVDLSLDGSATVAWTERQGGGGKRVMFSTTDNVFTGQWEPPVPLENGAFSANSPVVDRDAKGGSTIAWTSVIGSPGNNRSDVYAQRVGTGALSGQLLETSDEGSVASEVQMAGLASGGGVAVWAQDVDPQEPIMDPQLFSNRFDPATGQWGQAERLDAGAATGPGEVIHLKLVTDLAGRALVLRLHESEAGARTLMVNALR